jgi:hypothetical protein
MKWKSNKIRAEMIQIFTLVFVECHAMVTLTSLCSLNCIVIFSFYCHNSRDQRHVYESRLYHVMLVWIVCPIKGKPLLNEEALGQHWNDLRLTGCEHDIWGLNCLQVYGNVLLPNQFCGSPSILSWCCLPRSETCQPVKLMTRLHLVLSLVMHGALRWNL